MKNRASPINLYSVGLTLFLVSMLSMEITVDRDFPTPLAGGYTPGL